MKHKKKPSNKTIVNRIKRGVLCCPECGNTNIHWDTYNGAAYPEVWYVHTCTKCKMTVAYQNNSPLVTVIDEIRHQGARSIKEMRAVYRGFYNNGIN